MMQLEYDRFLFLDFLPIFRGELLVSGNETISALIPKQSAFPSDYKEDIPKKSHSLCRSKPQFLWRGPYLSCPIQKLSPS